jgi:hypothetical protein
MTLVALAAAGLVLVMSLVVSIQTLRATGAASSFVVDALK